jgi:hypothetical protein
MLMRGILRRHCFRSHSSFLLFITFLFALGCSVTFAAEIKLAWDANTESDLAGYKIYYGTSPRTGTDPKSCSLCGYSTVVTAGKVTSYTLGSLINGQKYYVSLTAKDTSNNESGFSNEVNGTAKDPTSTQNYTITTNPLGLQITVDGTTFTAPQTFGWVQGSSHTFSVSSPQGGTGSRYVFASWSDGGAQTHTVTIPSSSTTYTASFTTQYSLTASASPSGGGTVSPSGVNWYNSDQIVSVSATASAGYSFSSWTGDQSGSTNPISLTMSGEKSITGNFTQNQYTLTVSISPSAGGSVTKSPNKSTYVYGDQVTLTAAANAGYTFGSWSGDTTGTTSPTTITINSNKAVMANFTQNQYTLTVSVNPSGGGSVTKSPNKSTYVYGDQVILTATANSGYSFGSWSGDASGTASPANVTVNSNKAVTANFTAIAETVSTPTTPTGSGSGVTGTSYSYSTGGATSNLGHSVEYQFDWKGDGTDLSGWGVATQSKSWTVAGTYQVRARARCVSHTGVVSGWSGSFSVTISQATVSCTVTTIPSGLQVVVDGTTYNAPQTFSWVPGYSHTILVSSPQSGGAEVEYVYSSWSDGGGQSHVVTVPSSSMNYTAKFLTQHSLSWVQLSGGTPSSPALAWNPVANKLHIVTQGHNKSFIWAGTFDSSGVFNNDWTLIPGITSSAPALAWNPEANKLHIVVQHSDESIWAGTFNASGVFNDDWTRIPGLTPSAPALAWNPVANKLHIVTQGHNKSFIWAGTFDSSGVFNNDWTLIPGITSSAPALAWNPEANKLHIVVQHSDKSIWAGTFNASGVFNDDWTRIPGLTSSAPALIWDASIPELCVITKGAYTDWIWFGTFSSSGHFNNDWVILSGKTTPSSPGITYLPSIGSLEIVVQDSDESLWWGLY